MSRALIPLLFFLLPIAAAAEKPIAQGGPSVSVKNNGRLVEYCPDNTCEVFSVRNGKESAALADFTLAYLYAVSDYVYLEEFQSRMDLHEVDRLLMRYQADCPQLAQRAAARCVAGHLARKYPIRVTFVRYDERRKYSEPVSLERLRNAFNGSANTESQLQEAASPLSGAFKR